MNETNEKVLSILDVDYRNWIQELKSRYKKSQIKAAIRVNSELIRFYWELGRDIVKMKADVKWGSKFYVNLSKDLREQFPDSRGFSITNLKVIKQFYELFPEEQIGQQLVAQLSMIPWGHLMLIIGRVNKNIKKAQFYVQQIIKNNWSRNVLLNFLDTDLYERYGKSVNNFELSMPKEDGELSNELIKDPYIFNFLSIDKDYTEKELKDAIEANIQKFLIELGTGFAYIGREYRLLVGETELFIDMLFYNTRVHAYVVVEIKTGKFKPEYLGQLGTYVVAVNHQLKTDRDDKTIGILICKDKDNVLARYSLETTNQPLGITEYELSNLIPEKFKSSLPTIEEIENELNKK